MFLNWINGVVIGMAIGIIIETIIFFNFVFDAKFQKMRKSLVFVEHIENHLENDPEFQFNRKSFKSKPVVLCKICDTTIDDIYKLEGKKK